MSEPRKIVLILGNGFDLDLGLKTSYKDFWESDYCPKDYPAPLIRHLNQRWQDDLDAVRWYDLENELMSYYKSLPNPNTGEEFFTEEEITLIKDFSSYNFGCGFYNDRIDVVNSLIEKGVLKATRQPLGGWYVEEIYDKKECLSPPSYRDLRALSQIKEGLCNYLKSLSWAHSENDTMAGQILGVMNYRQTQGDIVDIYSFNFTRVLYRNHEPKAQVHYMHGSCDDGSIIIGTRDDVDMVREYDFLQKVMADDFNSPDIVTALREADEVIIFGHSLGQNDRQYFAPFFKRQSEENNPTKKDIVIITSDTLSKREVKRSMQKMTDGHLSSLFSINQPLFIRTKEIEKDCERYKDFLEKHGLSEIQSEEQIRILLKKQNAFNNTKN